MGQAPGCGHERGIDVFLPLILPLFLLSKNIFFKKLRIFLLLLIQNNIECKVTISDHG